MTQQQIITTPANSGQGDSPKSAFDKINANFADLYGGAGFAGFIQTPAEAAAGMPITHFNFPPFDLRRYSTIVADGVTDNTAAILAVTALLPGNYYAAFNILFNRATLIAGLAVGVIINDDSEINDYTGSYNVKHLGITSGDIATNESHWAVANGHHAVYTLNNFGTSGTASAAGRLASYLWCGGEFALGGLTNRGYRDIGIMQWAKDNSGPFWKWHLRSLAPWVSAAGYYEQWAAGQVISGAGVYRANGNNHYVSAGAGTTVNPGPVNTSGTAPDGGGVQWTWLDVIDRSTFAVDQWGRFLVGGPGAWNSTWNFNGQVLAPDGGQANVNFSAQGVSKSASLSLTPSTAGGTASGVVPFFIAQDGVGLRLFDIGQNMEMFRASFSAGNGGLAFPNAVGTRAPPTIASAATIAPTAPVSFVSGVTAINTITPPPSIQGMNLGSGSYGGQITLIPTGLWSTGITGNIALATTAVVSKALTLSYDSVSAKWYPSY